MPANFKKLDWVLFLSIMPLLAAGLISMKSFDFSPQGAGDYFFWRQLIWIGLGLILFFGISFADLRWLRFALPLILIYFAVNLMLAALLIFGQETKGAVSWLKFGAFSFEPSELVKIILILILAKYFSRRHIEIANFKHIIVSGLYAFLPAALVFLQPDLGSAIVISALWFAMIMASGISKKHFFILVLAAILLASLLWFSFLEPYQRSRIYSFFNPYLDPLGAGYHTIQAKIAIGSGGLYGRGIGFGSQSRLEFLPEHQTDFIFAAYAEEWGFLGVTFLFIFFALVVWRVARTGSLLNDNFGRLYAVGLGALLVAQFLIHVGMNIGFLPITGLPLPFVSYGGSSLLVFFLGLGILMSLKINSPFSAGER
ncbi:MAG: rod shape-determining protein RodA [Candidatus Niyogibacteria bacterium]|nr:MAG: rod shape-determining protein RodA [Candidatus Niyogibacteria bacterium]